MQKRKNRFKEHRVSNNPQATGQRLVSAGIVKTLSKQDAVEAGHQGRKPWRKSGSRVSCASRLSRLQEEEG
jgi:hypothetical protein